MKTPTKEQTELAAAILEKVSAASERYSLRPIEDSEEKRRLAAYDKGYSQGYDAAVNAVIGVLETFGFKVTKDDAE